MQEASLFLNVSSIHIACRNDFPRTLVGYTTWQWAQALRVIEAQACRNASVTDPAAGRQHPWLLQW